MAAEKREGVWDVEGEFVPTVPPLLLALKEGEGVEIPGVSVGPAGVGV